MSWSRRGIHRWEDLLFSHNSLPGWQTLYLSERYSDSIDSLYLYFDLLLVSQTLIIIPAFISNLTYPRTPTASPIHLFSSPNFRNPARRLLLILNNSTSWCFSPALLRVPMLELAWFAGIIVWTNWTFDSLQSTVTYSWSDFRRSIPLVPADSANLDPPNSLLLIRDLSLESSSIWLRF